MTKDPNTKPEIEAFQKWFDSGQRLQWSDLVRWMQSDEIETLGAVFMLLHEHADRIETMPPMDMAINFCSHYFRRCLVENPSGDYADSRYTAAYTLESWYKALRRDRRVPRKFLRQVREMLREVYEQGDEDIRTCIVHGALEHLFEAPEIVKEFADWKQNPSLRKAYGEALEWTRGSD